MAWTTLCTLSELTEGQGKPVDIDGYRLAVFLDKGQPYVLDDTCPHAAASMSGGWIDNGCAVCPRHLWRFELETGKLAGGGEALRRYATRTIERGDDVWLQVDLAMP